MALGATWHCDKCGYEGPYVLGISGIVADNHLCPHCLELWLKANVGTLRLVSIRPPPREADPTTTV